MDPQYAFFEHIMDGMGESATPLMARIALNLAYDANAFPVCLEELRELSANPRAHESFLFRELLVADFVRSAMLGLTRPWTEAELQDLQSLPGVRAKAPVLSIVRGS